MPQKPRRWHTALPPGVEALHARELFLAADAAPLRQKAVQLQALAE